MMIIDTKEIMLFSFDVCFFFLEISLMDIDLEYVCMVYDVDGI